MKLTKKARVISVSLAAAAVVASLGAVYAADSYSTENDPLVTLSYVEQLKSQLKDELLAELSQNTQPSADADAAEFEVVTLTEGQSIMADGGGACEIVLRSGSARVLITQKDNIDAGVGLSDLTAGKEIINNTALDKNHYLIASRSDGRGAYVTSATAYFMVRGGYKIVD